MVLFSPFSNVYIQDSTIISIPDELSSFYKGSVSKGKQKSSVRIQTIYELKKGKYIEFDLGSFTDNDQGSSGKITKILKKGDLIIRDLGYFAIKVFKKIAEMDAYFLSRYKYGVNIYDKTTKEKLSLRDILNKNFVDINVIIGKEEQLHCRMVAIKISDAIANTRRRKAKQNRNKRVNYSAEYYFSLGWVIYITNVKRDIFECKKIMAAYRFRWLIEIIFKAWKSNFNIVKLVPEKPKANKNSKTDLKNYKHRIDTVIYMMLIFIVIFQIKIYLHFVFMIIEKYQKLISLLKLSEYVAINIERIFKSNNLNEFEVAIAYYTTYEKRKKRKNYLERFLLSDSYEY